MLPLKSVIVDDEWLVREELKILLAHHPEISVLGEAANVSQAVELCNQLHPDVIFLDIQMPGATGFDLLEKCKINSKIIFITAYNQYAIKAFEVNASDYLLKPINKDRLSKAVMRLFTNEQSTTNYANKLNYDGVVYVLVDGSLKFIKLNLLKCISAEGNYSYIYYRDRKKSLVSKTLQEWDNVLPKPFFVRIHRSTIVNFEYVEQVKKFKNNSHQVFVRDIEKPFTRSRRYDLQGTLSY